jgi:hypothetical protein
MAPFKNSLVQLTIKYPLALSFGKPSHLGAQFLVFIFQSLHAFLQRRQRFPNFFLRETRNYVLLAISIERLNANHKNSLNYRPLTRIAHLLDPFLRLLSLEYLAGSESNHDGHSPKGPAHLLTAPSA